MKDFENKVAAVNSVRAIYPCEQEQQGVNFTFLDIKLL
jgi:hypothetical protein